MKKEKWISTSEAARLTGLSARTIRTKAESGEIKADVMEMTLASGKKRRYYLISLNSLVKYAKKQMAPELLDLMCRIE